MSGYLAYAEYKDSGIEWLGKIPTHWTAKRFKFLVAEPLKYGANEAAELTDPDLPRYIRITDVKDDGNLREETFRSLPEDVAKDYLLEEGDILLARSGATVGKTFIYELSWGKAAYAGYLIRARMSDEVNSRFIYQFLQSNSYLEWVKSIFIQATIQNISAEKYANLWLPVPSIKEQRSIARFLDYKTAQIDALITKKETLLKKLAEKRTTLISQAVTKGCDRTVPMKDSGIVWLGEIPEHWESGLVKRYFSVELGKMLNRSLVVEGGVTKPYLRAANIHWRKVLLNDVNEMDFSHSQLIRYRLEKGDLLVTEGGVTVGRSAIWEGELEECYYQNSINRVRPRNSSSAEFLYYWMYFMKNNDYIDLAANIATFGHLTQEKLQTLPIVMPPIAEQKKIVSYLDAQMLNIEQQEVKINEVIEGLKEYRTALITNAVTGKIDVRDVMLELEPVEAA